MMKKYLITHARLLDPASGTDMLADVCIANGIVAEIGQAGSLLHADAEIIHAQGLWLVPGLIDMHVHMREPGEEAKEDIGTACRAAVFGGFTTVLAMPNTKPVLDTAAMIRYVQERGREVGLCKVLVAGAVTVQQAGKQLAPFVAMQKAGAVALTDDGHPVANAHMMRAALAYAADCQMPLLTHAEEPALTLGCHMHQGTTSIRLGLLGSPRAAEDIAVARDIMLAEDTGAHLHVCHVSTHTAVDLIRAAKSRHVRVTAEATPHHFTLTDIAVGDYQTYAKMNPPLREYIDQMAVIEGLKDGTIDAIATDHAPHGCLDKDVPFAEAACGVIGLQTALPLALALWRQGHMPLLDVLARLTTGPARVLNISAGSLHMGAQADLALIDPEATWVFDKSVVLSKSHNSPFLGWQLQGQVKATMYAGTWVF